MHHPFHPLQDGGNDDIHGRNGADATTRLVYGCVIMDLL